MTALAPVIAIGWGVLFALGVSLLLAAQVHALWRDLRSWWGRRRADAGLALALRAEAAAEHGLRLVPVDEVGARRELRRTGGTAA